MKELDLLSTTAGVLQWDNETGMPSANAPYRGEQVALLAGMVHERFTSPETGDLIDRALQSLPRDGATGSDAAVNLREWKRDYDLARKLPQSLVEELSRTPAEAHPAWVEARKEKDFKVFQPWLERIVALVRRKAECLGYAAHPYDALLDEYEPGLTVGDLDALFPPLLERLSSLSRRLQASDRKPDASILARPCPVAAQEAFCRLLASSVGFDLSQGRIDRSAHPFSTGLGPADTRLTTRFDERDFSNAFFSTLHEAGHGIYDQGLPREHFGTPRAGAVSLGIHESQSRLWENLVGRSTAFWAFFFPRLRSAFPGVFDDVGAEAFVFAVNRSAPSFIRTESDEVTYNLHIGVRYGIEKDLVTGALKPAEVPEAWDGAMERSLGVRPPDAAVGCLQDVHWSHGSLGYFPTYTLGNLYSAQFFEAARRDLGDLEGMFTKGDFAPLKGWLNAKIHAPGKTWRAGELCARVTGKPLSPEPFLSYLEAKFGDLYGV
jgi:carboxypeptidase Taq